MRRGKTGSIPSSARCRGSAVAARERLERRASGSLLSLAGPGGDRCVSRDQLHAPRCRLRPGPSAGSAGPGGLRGPCRGAGGCGRAGRAGVRGSGSEGKLGFCVVRWWARQRDGDARGAGRDAVRVQVDRGSRRSRASRCRRNLTLASDIRRGLHVDRAIEEWRARNAPARRCGSARGMDRVWGCGGSDIGARPCAEGEAVDFRVGSWSAGRTDPGGWGSARGPSHLLVAALDVVSH